MLGRQSKKIYAVVLQADDSIDQPAELVATFKSKPSKKAVVKAFCKHIEDYYNVAYYAPEGIRAEFASSPRGDVYNFHRIYNEGVGGADVVEGDDWRVEIETTELYD